MDNEDCAFGAIKVVSLDHKENTVVPKVKVVCGVVHLISLKLSRKYLPLDL